LQLDGYCVRSISGAANPFGGTRAGCLGLGGGVGVSGVSPN